MAGVNFNFKVYGDTAINRELTGYQERISDWRPVFRVLRQDFFEMEKAQFASEGERGGERWVALSVKRVQAKANHRPKLSPKIMQATGALLRSLTILGAKGSTSRVTNTSMAVGSTVPYGKYHQKPNRAGRVQRKIIQFTEADKRRWIRELQSYLHSQGLRR